jgi:hypothetical protein
MMGRSAMEVIDYNGENDWSREALLRRYAEYCRRLKIRELDLKPLEVLRDNKKWIFPVLYKVIDGIEQGDAACKLIGIEFIEEDRKFPFGKVLKSNTARALRRGTLTEEDKERIRKRLTTMLLQGNVPHEYKQYSKLLKKIGLGNYRDEIEKSIDRSNPYVMKYYRYLTEA